MRCWATKPCSRSSIRRIISGSPCSLATVLLNGWMPTSLTFPRQSRRRHDAGRRPALPPADPGEFEVGHVLVGRIKRHLQVRRDANRPVKAIGVIGLATALFHQRHRFFICRATSAGRAMMRPALPPADPGEFEVGHVLVGRIKRHLQVRRDANRPVKAIGVIGLATALFTSGIAFSSAAPLPRVVR